MDQTPTTFRVNALHIFGLSCAAVAQPIFDLLGRNGGFFVSSRSGATEILALTFALTVCVPALLVLVELAAGAIGERVRRAIHLTFVLVLMTGIALPIARHFLPPRDALILIVSASLGLLGAVAYARRAGARQIVSWVAALSVLAPLNFLVHSDATKVLFSSNGGSVHGAVAANTPVVVLIFDELPLASLLDEHLEIDSVRYPNFAALAARAYWFRNATTVSDTTTHAVPAILTGRRADLHLLPTVRDHPDNIFSWLGGSYRVESREPVTALCPAAVCLDRADGAHVAKLAAMASDVAIILGHALMPPGVAAGVLPRIDQGWHNFGGHGGQTGLDTMTMPNDARDVAITSNQKSLYVLHFLLPHVPWRYLPSGRVYGLSEDIRGLKSEHWVDDASLVVEGYQRHLLQVAYVDRVLGDTLAKLKSARIYDDALVIVAADHGCSFHPGGSRRALRPANWADVLRVPLLVKLPAQQTGIVSDRAVETIDILPTIATVLDAPLPFAVDGISMLPETDRPSVKRTAISDQGEEFSVPDTLAGLQESASRKTNLFGSGGDTRKLFGAGRFWRLVDQPVARLQAAPAADLRAKISDLEWFATVAPEKGFVPALVEGSVTGGAIHGHEAVVAVAINGVVRAVAPLASSGQQGAFQTVVSEASFINGQNDLQILLVDGPEDHPVARAVSLTESASRLVSTDGNEQLEIAGQRVPVRSGDVVGFVDRTSRSDMGNYLSVLGWVLDPSHGGLPDILVLADGKKVGSATPTGDRPDVAAATGDPEGGRSGFAVRVPLGALAGARALRVFAISRRGVASELGYPVDFEYLPEMGYTLSSSLGGDRLTSPKGDTVRIDRTAIQGYVDTWSWSNVDEQDYLSVSGWAVDRAKAEPISVILFAGDRPVAACTTDLPTPRCRSLPQRRAVPAERLRISDRNRPTGPGASASRLWRLSARCGQ